MWRDLAAARERGHDRRGLRGRSQRRGGPGRRSACQRHGRCSPGWPTARSSSQDFADGFFPYDGREIKAFFETLKAQLAPDLILTHQRHDLHQDHRLTCELTWNTWRDHLILEYEVPKYDGDMGRPNLFVTLDAELCRRKIAHLMTHFESQSDKRWFKEDLFSGLLRLRGMECNSPTSFAEAFYCRKAVLA